MKDTAVMRCLASLIRFILLIVLLWGAKGGAPSVSGQEKSEPPAFAGYAEKDLEWAQAITGWPTLQDARNLRFQADQEVFRFLISHPDFTAALSHGIDHEKIFVTRKEDNLFDIRHGHAKGMFWSVERNPDRAAYLAVGIYDNPALSWIGIAVRARAYVIETFKWKPAKGSPPGETAVSIRAYLRVENAFLGWIFKLFAPFVRTAFEDKLTGVYRIAPELSQMAFEDSNGFLKKIEAIQGLDPERSRRFIELVRKQKKGRTSRRFSRLGPSRPAQASPGDLKGRKYPQIFASLGLSKTSRAFRLSEMLFLPPGEGGLGWGLSR